ncbi:MAG: hypothetical protein LC104_02250 [Bacteroidales bacterium]|nr:hypothetical protein [Bacteroidales bacterium]
MARKRAKAKAKPPAESVAPVEPVAPPESAIPVDPMTPASSPWAPKRPFPWRGLTQVGLGLGLSVGLVAGIVWLGQQAGLQIAGEGRYAVRFTDIVCDNPPGVERTLFLTEVRYLGRLPETVQSVSPSLSEQLTTAFTAHPWVRRVDAVTVMADGTIQVHLTFRQPVLAVPVADDSLFRLVDAVGVLLPLSTGSISVTDTDTLTQLKPVFPPPARSAGQVWPDPDVVRAAELAVEYQPRTIEKTQAGWHLIQKDGQVLRIGR